MLIQLVIMHTGAVLSALSTPPTVAVFETFFNIMHFQFPTQKNIVTGL